MVAFVDDHFILEHPQVSRRLAALLAVSIDRAEERSEGSATHTVFIVRVQGQGHDYELETRYSAIANLRKVSLV